jgi:hypothetical protein
VAKITIKRKTASGTELLYPTTTVDQIISEGTGSAGADESLSSYLDSTFIPLSQRGVASGVATLDENAQLTLSQLPVAVVGGLSFEGTIDLSTTKDVDDILDAINVNRANIDIGDYLQVSATGDINQGTTYTGGVNAPGDEGDYDLSDGITLEAGDWIVVSDINTTNQTVTFGIVNNTYRNATTSTTGMVTLSNISDLDGAAGNDVITDGVLAGLIGTAANTIAAGNHNHSGVYEPVITKNTAFNKDFGTSAGQVAEGNHTHAQYLELDGTDTMTGDLALGAEGTGTTEDSLSVKFTGRALNTPFTKELKMTDAGVLTFNDKRVYTIEDTTMGRVFWDTESGTVEGDFIFDEDAA